MHTRRTSSLLQLKAAAEMYIHCIYQFRAKKTINSLQENRHVNGI